MQCNNLNPVWVGEGDLEVEALSVQSSVKEMGIQVVNVYVPQE